METKRSRAEALVQQYKQEHLLQFISKLSDEQSERLLDQILQLDFAQLSEAMNTDAPSVQQQSHLEPMDVSDWDDFDQREQAYFADKGRDLLRNGKVGVIVVAGGQGSRLGHEGPKGTFDIGLPSGKSLFQLQAERLLNLSRSAGRPIPWYIMTSPENHAETVQFFKDAHYFGYAEEDCYFFLQGVMPAVDAYGNILLAGQGEIGLAPSGNGECFAALKQSGALDDMKRRGVEWLFYYNVDNALIKIADPLFAGVAAHFGHPIATKVVEKAYPEEKVGILCLRDGRPSVVEYTDVPEEVMLQKDGEGKLLFGMGNISIHLFRLDFIEKHAGTAIPYHKAHKKIKYIGESGELIRPDAPNAYKFERFIFDFFPLADKMTVLKMKREEQFAPVKNKDGVDSPATARQLVFDLHRKWLLDAGVPAGVIQGRDIEISPLVSYSGEGLDQPDVLRSLGFAIGNE
ncbi:putative uridylyltransferase [Paenibacillus allorhizosphaerae]|uniref:Uridylyltransferase n=1 Tax=Paenibacillus allorhizosphaerae TaxID=2849866 RepID=A0ABM8VSI0_9BACL|nr:UTP--glucose-1-phosphate uridylyltransferase [Paenibacillus allorhizosphaerae]CAG7656484.1 putative uridylyltransferase [Paenibacillus allorhizosphaerae]